MTPATAPRGDAPAGQTRPSPLPCRKPAARRRLLGAGLIGSAALATAFGFAAIAAATLPRVALAQGVNGPLPRIALTAGLHRINAEVADTDQTRARGLMMRERLGPNEGMLFIFPEAATHCFWMKNTPLPLSIAFIDDEGRIVNIADMAPRSEDTHCPRRAIRFALEMEQGWFDRKGIAAGQKIGGLPNEAQGAKGRAEGGSPASK